MFAQHLKCLADDVHGIPVPAKFDALLDKHFVAGKIAGSMPLTSMTATYRHGMTSILRYARWSVPKHCCVRTLMKHPYDQNGIRPDPVEDSVIADGQDTQTG